MPAFDIVVRRARLRRASEALQDIAIAGGRIAAIGERVHGAAATEIDARGGLASESFVNPHLHLCKVYTLFITDDEAARAYHAAGMRQAMSAIELAARVKANYDERWIIGNVRRALALAALYGTTHVRAFADVDGKARLEGVRALLRARQEFKGVVDVQVVAFAQDGLAREPGAAELMREAMALGADVVGGIPWIEHTAADTAAHIDFCFELACEFDRDVSMLVDDAGDAGLRTLEAMAAEAVKRGWQGRALAHHARAMALYPDLENVIPLMRQARMSLVTDPHTGPLHARVKELLAGGVNVCLGQDDISDSYYPFGRNNMLEVAFLAAHLLWMTTRLEMETLYDMVTTRAAQAIGVGHKLEVGAPANLVVLEAPDVLEALREHAAPLAVVSHGKLIDQAKMRHEAAAV